MRKEISPTKYDYHQVHYHNVVNPLVVYLLNRAAEYYDLGKMHRKYHNIEHALKVVSALHQITSCPSDELVLAAMWHDAIYFPGAIADANEYASAAALNMEFMVFMQQTGAHREIVNNAMTLIAGTTVNMHLDKLEQRGDLAILLDADLKSLAAPYDEFIETQKNIVAEHNATWEQGKAKCAAFLVQFLNIRKNIYHTEYGRKYWQEQAIDNICRLIEEVK